MAGDGIIEWQYICDERWLSRSLDVSKLSIIAISTKE